MAELYLEHCQTYKDALLLVYQKWKQWNIEQNLNANEIYLSLLQREPIFLVFLPYFYDKKWWRYGKPKCKTFLEWLQPIGVESQMDIFKKNNRKNSFIGPYSWISTPINIKIEKYWSKK